MDWSDFRAFASHQKVLLYALNLNDKPILELGSGDASTPLIHAVVAPKRLKILTLDQNLEWLKKYTYLKNEFHSFGYYSDEDIYSFYASDSEQWGLVFIDNGTWNARTEAVKKYADIADYIILHDCDYFADSGELGFTIEPIENMAQITGKRDYSKYFKYWIEFFPENWEAHVPPTLLASNKVSLDGVIIDGMIISSRNT